MRFALVALATVILSSTAPSIRGAQIRAFANRWLGTPYRWGGNSRNGIDCSAYLRQMYRDLFNIDLPRTTRQQIDLGVDLSINKAAPGQGLEPGDLIFYIDSTGTPNHVVVYMGGNMITHSVSGRGVVIEPIRKIFGRRIVARRLLRPARDGAGFGPIPPAGPIVVQDIPCPADYKAKRFEVRMYTSKPIGEIKQFGDRDICDFRALADALRANGGDVAKENAKKLDAHAEWLQSIDALKGTIGRGW